MIQFVVAIGVILILAIILILFRIGNLLSIVRKDDRKVVESGANKTNAFLMVGFMVVSLVVSVWYSVVYFDDYNLPLASEHGAVTDQLFWITMAVTGIIFFITQILLFWFGYKYQYKETNKAFFYPDNNKLEMIWTIVPAIVLTILIFGGLKAWNDITSEAPEEAEVVEIMGYQFAWGSRYPGKDGQLGDFNYRLIDVDNYFGVDFTDNNAHDDFIPREIHLPKGKPVLFKIRARDVLHSVFAPHFRLKMDAVPGMPTKFWFVPTKTTAEMRAETNNPDFNYEIACTEICGRGHFSMRMLVVVDEPEDYEKWKAEQEPWLVKNPSYLSKIPEDKRELAMINAGIDPETVEF